MEKEKALQEINRLREQLHQLYLRDNGITEAVLHTSVLLDRSIYAYLKAGSETLN